jgi:hypothetical protein
MLPAYLRPKRTWESRVEKAGILVIAVVGVWIKDQTRSSFWLYMCWAVAAMWIWELIFWGILEVIRARKAHGPS